MGVPSAEREIQQMYTSENLTTAAQGWRTAANALLQEAERIGPLEDGVFGELGTEDEGIAAARRIDQQVDDLLRNGDLVFTELENSALESIEVRYQTASLLVSALAVGDALAVAGQSPSDVFGGLASESEQAAVFADARAAVVEADAMISVPTSVSESLEKIEVAGAAESWKILTGSAGKLAGGALVSGLEGILKGSAAAAFDVLKDQLNRWRDTLKRGVLRIAKWVVDKVKSFLPEPMTDKVDDLMEFLEKKIGENLSNAATDLYGSILGRREAEHAWQEAAAAGADVRDIEDKLGAITATHTGRIAWVTKGRKIIEKYDHLASGVVGLLPPQAKITFAALVAAILIFVAIQVWDGFNDIEALV